MDQQQRLIMGYEAQCGAGNIGAICRDLKDMVSSCLDEEHGNPATDQGIGLVVHQLWSLLGGWEPTETMNGYEVKCAFVADGYGTADLQSALTHIIKRCSALPDSRSRELDIEIRYALRSVYLGTRAYLHDDPTVSSSTYRDDYDLARKAYEASH